MSPLIENFRCAVNIAATRHHLEMLHQFVFLYIIRWPTVKSNTIYSLQNSASFLVHVKLFHRIVSIQHVQQIAFPAYLIFATFPGIFIRSQLRASSRKHFSRATSPQKCDYFTDY